MSVLYFLKNFNNYYNRRIKFYSLISEYIAAADDYEKRGTSAQYQNGDYVNFAPKDGVNTTTVLNRADSLQWQPDYIVVMDDKEEVIESRWFIIESDITRAGQLSIQLRRDLVADNYSKVIKAPIFIEKATLQPDSPFLYNSENMTFNQIKDEDEMLLKDGSQTPWIVGYVASPQNNEGTTNVTGTMFKNVYKTTPGTILQFLSSFPSALVWKDSDWNIEYTVKEEAYSSTYKPVTTYSAKSDGSGVSNSAVVGGSYDNLKYQEKNYRTLTRQNLKNKIIASTTLRPALKASIQSNSSYRWTDTSNEPSYYEYNGKIIKSIADGKYYQLQVVKTKVDLNHALDISVEQSSYPSLYTSMKDIADDVFKTTNGTLEDFAVFQSGDVYNITLTQAEVQSTNIVINTAITTQRKILSDAPYCMFCMPYFTTSMIEGSDEVLQSPEVSMCTARALCETLTNSKVYDLQLLPYCPIPGLINNNKINLNLFENKTEHQDFERIYIPGDGMDILSGFILWADSSTFSTSITKNISIPSYTGANTAESIKIENETSQYRLCSPNYASVYEFNLAKNGGVEYFVVDCQYKPYNPYIHIVPNLGNLYGSVTGDARGLVCSGDFSLPQTSDQWAQFEINNKNYNNSFNRQIENLQVNQKLDMISMGTSALLGAGTGAIQGARAGGVAGAVIGGLLSAGAGAADLAIQDKKNKEVIDYTQDQFGYALGNIKARPDTLSKVSGYNPNNKLFPFVEHYHATEQERNALLKKIRYNGMSLGIIDVIENYLYEEETYIKGKIIRIEGMDDEYHMASELAEELNKGVFIR